MAPREASPYPHPYDLTGIVSSPIPLVDLPSRDFFARFFSNIGARTSSYHEDLSISFCRSARPPEHLYRTESWMGPEHHCGLHRVVRQRLPKKTCEAVRDDWNITRKPSANGTLPLVSTASHGNINPTASLVRRDSTNGWQPSYSPQKSPPRPLCPPLLLPPRLLWVVMPRAVTTPLL